MTVVILRVGSFESSFFCCDGNVCRVRHQRSDVLMLHDEEADSPLKGRESFHFKQIDSKESNNFLVGEDVKIGLGSVLRIQS